MLARIISLKFESTTCCGILKPYLIMDAELSYLSQKLRPLGSFSFKDFYFYLLQQLITYYLDVGLFLHFYHADLRPNNIMILEKGNVKRILDQKSTKFYPQYQIASKPMRSASFYFKFTEGTKRDAQHNLLRNMLEKENFKPI